MPIEVGEAGVSPSEEDVKFLPSGKVMVIIDGRTHVLRRPKLGEFRHFREVLYEEQDQAHAELLKKADELIAEAANGDVTTRTPEQRRQELIDIVEQSRKIRLDTERQEEHYVRWSREVIETLSGIKIEIEDGDLPFLVGTGDFVTAVQRHWRTVPFGSGGK